MLTPYDISKLEKGQILKRTVFSTKTGNPLYQYLVRFVQMGGTFNDGILEPKFEPGVLVNECDLLGKPKNTDLYPVRLSHLSLKED